VLTDGIGREFGGSMVDGKEHTAEPTKTPVGRLSSI
jgi:hypothetical protein